MSEPLFLHKKKNASNAKQSTQLIKRICQRQSQTFFLVPPQERHTHTRFHRFNLTQLGKQHCWKEKIETTTQHSTAQQL